LAAQQKEATQDIASTMHEFEIIVCQNAQHAQDLYGRSQELETLASEQRAIAHQLNLVAEQKVS
jgi:methyl-accepting chemotaxis protein